MSDKREYVDRFYRESMAAEGMVGFSVALQTTDLFILAERDLTDAATEAAGRARATVERWIRRVPEFETALGPLPCPADAPPMIRAMSAAGEAANVGPMAAVAGAVAESVARDLSELSPNVIVENGGDTYVMGSSERTVAIFAAESPLSNRLALSIPPARQPVAVCTSSGTVGHSLSLGKADAVVIVGEDAALVDAVATAAANKVTGAGDLADAVHWAAAIEGVEHVVAIIGESMAAWGDLEMKRIQS